MLIYTSIGDSYGLSFEFVSEEYVAKNNDALGYKNREKETKGWQDHFPGMYSDDTDCAIATLQTMLTCDVFEAETYIMMWQSVLLRNPNRGYSKKTKSMLSTMQFRNIVNSTRNSRSNGCLMGAHFLGLYPTQELVLKACINKCLPMHANIECIIATTFVAMTAHYLYYSKVSMRDALESALIISDLKFNYDPLARILCDASITAQAIHKVLSESLRIEDVLLKSIERGGDVDSVASIALGLYSLLNTNEVLPKAFYEDIEKPFNSDLFTKIWNKLIEKYPK